MINECKKMVEKRMTNNVKARTTISKHGGKQERQGNKRQILAKIQGRKGHQVMTIVGRIRTNSKCQVLEVAPMRWTRLFYGLLSVLGDYVVTSRYERDANRSGCMHCRLHCYQNIFKEHTIELKTVTKLG